MNLSKIKGIVGNLVLQVFDILLFIAKLLAPDLALIDYVLKKDLQQ